MELYDILTVDFETTGVDAKTAHPVEVAVVPLYGAGIVQFIKPPVSIPPETSAVHHITDEDVANAPDWATVKPMLAKYVEDHDRPIFVAHNARYEQDILGEFVDGLPWICTYKAALRVWPDAPSHKNEVLRYWLKLGPLGRSASAQTHSAYHDACVTQLLLLELLKVATVDEMIQWTKEPAKLPKMPMGKYFGMKWEAVPADYLQWLLRQADMREDVVYCAKEELERRRKTYGKPH